MLNAQVPCVGNNLHQELLSGFSPESSKSMDILSFTDFVRGNSVSFFTLVVQLMFRSFYFCSKKDCKFDWFMTEIL